MTRGKVDPFEVYMETQRLALVATNAIEDAMARRKINRTKLARILLGVPKSRVTKVLAGGNLTLRTLAQFSLAAGFRFEIGAKR